MLRQKIQDDQLLALKQQKKNRLNTLRYIVSQIKNKEIDLRKELNDEETTGVLLKIKKELQESLQSFTQGGRNDLVAETQEQMDIVTEYLPKALTDEELEKAVSILHEKNKEAVSKNPKSLIGICMKELRSKADPDRIMKAVQQSLAS